MKGLNRFNRRASHPLVEDDETVRSSLTTMTNHCSDGLIAKAIFFGHFNNE